MAAVFYCPLRGWLTKIMEILIAEFVSEQQYNADAAHQNSRSEAGSISGCFKRDSPKYKF